MFNVKHLIGSYLLEDNATNKTTSLFPTYRSTDALGVFMGTNLENKTAKNLKDISYPNIHVNCIFD